MGNVGMDMDGMAIAGMDHAFSCVDDDDESPPPPPVFPGEAKKL